MNNLIIFISGPPLDWRALEDLQNEVCYPCGLQTGMTIWKLTLSFVGSSMTLNTILKKGICRSANDVGGGRECLSEVKGNVECITI